MSAHRPEVLLAMSQDVADLQFGPRELERLSRLARLGDPLVTHDFSSPAVRRRLASVEVLITSWGCPPIDADVLAAAPELRAALHAAGSVRSHVGDAVFDRDVLVTTAAHVNAEPVAQYTVAAILWAFKKVPFLAADARRFREDWAYRDQRGELSGLGRTIVLVGFSRVGRRVVELLRRLHAGRVLVVDPVVNPVLVREAGAEVVTLAEALPQADVLSLHAPALPETHHLIGAAELAALPEHATLVNTARGSLVDTAALEEACAHGRLHAVLDVTDPEPLPAWSRLYDLPNVVLTPHVAGSLGSETRLMAAAALDELERYVSGQPPLEPVTRHGLAVQA